MCERARRRSARGLPATRWAAIFTVIAVAGFVSGLVLLQPAPGSADQRGEAEVADLTSAAPVLDLSGLLAETAEEVSVEYPAVDLPPAPAAGAESPKLPAGDGVALPAGETLVAHLAAGLTAAPVWRTPADAAPDRVLSERDEFGTRRAFRVLEMRGDWLHVQLPVRPNGSTGWMHLGDVELSATDHRIEVDLSDRTVTVLHRGEVVFETVGAIGRPNTPTPIGSFFLRSAFAWDPDSVYGPYVLALSSFSEAIDQINGGDAVVALHGTQRPDQLGEAVSLGCVRLDNEAITELAFTVPIGSPVDVVP